MKILLKLFSIVLMIAAPIISGKAFYEYVAVKYMHHQPSYPFGKAFMGTVHSSHIVWLSGYEKQMLTIAIVFLAITIIIYLSRLIKALVSLAWLAIVIFIAFFIYRLVQ